jgi:hypothetical protein
VGGNTTITGNITAANANVTSNLVLSGGTANGVAYLNGSKVLTTGSALVFDGTNLGVGVTPSAGQGRIQINGAGNSWFKFYDSAAGYNFGTFYKANGTTALAYLGGGTSAIAGGTVDDFVIRAEGNLLFATGGGTEKMRLDSSGNLLIGTTSGSARLNVGGSAPYMYVTDTAGANKATFVAESTNTIVNVGSSYLGTSAVPLALIVGGAEKARIDTSGNLLVGTTEANPALTGVTGVGIGPTGGIRQSSGSGASYFAVTGTSGTHIQFYTYNSGAVAAGLISSSGSTTTYAASSDYRLKDIEGPVIGAKDFIMALQPKQGTWKADGSKFVGFLAHEFQEVSPSSVIGVKDAVDEDGNPVMQAMQASSAEVMANLVSFVQELKAEIDSLKSQLNGA